MEKILKSHEEKGMNERIQLELAMAATLSY
jgi:hypothetical protein